MLSAELGDHHQRYGRHKRSGPAHRAAVALPRRRSGRAGEAQRPPAVPWAAVPWAKFAPGISESAGRKKGGAGTGHGNRYLVRALGEAAVGASRTDSFLGERYRRIARRRGKKRASSRSAAPF